MPRRFRCILGAVLALVLCVAPGAFGAITLDNAPATRQLAGSASSLTYSFTRAPGNGVLFVSAAVTDGLTATATYGGQSMTAVDSYLSASSIRIYQFRLINPSASGANNVVVTASGTATYVLATSVSFSGNIDPATNSAKTNDNSVTTLVSTPLSVSDGSYIVISGGADSHDVTAGTNVTATTSANPLTGRFGPRSGAGSTSLTIDSSAADNLYSIVTEVKESAAPAALAGHGEFTFEPTKFAGTFKVGVAADDVSGVASVAISVGGSLVGTPTGTTYNSDTCLFDYNVTATASNYADGAVAVSATITATSGATKTITTTIYANSGGALNDVVYYVGGSGASDSNSGTSLAPFATPTYAYQYVYDTRFALGGSRMDNVVFKLRAGSYTVASVNQNNYSDATTGYGVTFRADDGVSKAAVIFTGLTANGFGDFQAWNTSRVRVENITSNIGIPSRSGRTNTLTAKNVTFAGSDRYTTDFTQSNIANYYPVDCEYADCKRAIEAYTTARGNRGRRIGESFLHNGRTALANGCVDLTSIGEPGGSALHPDLLQWTSDPNGAYTSGLIARLIKTVDVRIQETGTNIVLNRINSKGSDSVYSWEVERPYVGVLLRNYKSDRVFGYSSTFSNVRFENVVLPSGPATATGLTLATTSVGDMTVTPSGGSALDWFDSYSIGSGTAGTAITKTFTVANPGTASLRVGAVRLIDPATGLTSTEWDVTADPSGTILASGSATLTVRLKNTATAGSKSVRMIVDNDAWDFHETTLTATLSAGGGDVTAPSRLAVTASGSSIVILYDEALDAASIPATGAFTHSTKTITAVGVAGNAVTLTISAPFTVGAAGGTLSYTAGGSPVQDAAGNDAANFATQTVANITSSTRPPQRLGVGRSRLGL